MSLPKVQVTIYKIEWKWWWDKTDDALATYQKAIQTAFREVADALADRGTIGEQLRGRRIRVLRRDRMAQRLGAGELFERGREPRVHANERAAVGLVAQ